MRVADDMKAHADSRFKKKEKKNSGMKETKKLSYIKGYRLKNVKCTWISKGIDWVIF